MALTSVTADTLHSAAAAFGSDPGILAENGGAWEIVAPAGANPAAVLGAILAPGGLTATLAIGAALSAGQVYTIACLGGAPVSFTAPDVDEPSAEWPHGPMAVLTRVIGESIQEFSGTPETRLVRTLAWDGTSAFVESTLGFAAAGAFWCAGRHYQYTSKTDVSFLGLTVDHTDGQAIGAGAVVTSDPSAVLPVE